MKIKLSEYAADFLAEHNITDVFTVVGGGAMHLNDSFGHCARLRCVFCHHEQACAMAAEAYARIAGKPAAVCVTTGPGGTNAITGVVGAWLDSIPMIVISGQVRYDTTARYAEKASGVKLRAMGDQEFDIVKAAEHMTKYAVMVEDANDIRYVLERALHIAVTGRPGPVWVDIPVDIQGAVIDTEKLRGYDPAEDAGELPPPVGDDVIEAVLAKIRAAKRPVFCSGSGIRHAGAYEVFKSAAEKLNIPVVTYFNAIDIIETEHPLYTGRSGNMGDRAGNFAVQNADLILAVGTRISIRQTGYEYKTWARSAEVIMVDADENELKKPTLHVEMPIKADARDFLEKLDARARFPEFGDEAWLETCREWKRKYPVVLPKHKEQKETVNVYAFIDKLSSMLPEGSVTAASNGACCVVGSQAFIIQKDSRFIINSAIASMGYGLPAAVGACIAGGEQSTVCLEGDGSIMMNLAELQTIITNRLPVKIFIINNDGYHSIRQTQRNLFSEHSRVGIGSESGDISFPNYELIAGAFGYTYVSAKNNREIEEAIERTLAIDGAAICEVFCDTQQSWEPKSSAKRLADGRIASPPLEDLAPFLPREELERNMFIPLLDKE